MNLLLDHCTWKETESILRKSGFVCVTLRELDKSEATNGEVIAIAKTKRAILITRDRDFSNLALYPLGTHEGIIFLRITPKNMDRVHKILLDTLHSIPTNRLTGSLLIITSDTYRLHEHK